MQQLRIYRVRPTGSRPQPRHTRSQSTRQLGSTQLTCQQAKTHRATELDKCPTCGMSLGSVSEETGPFTLSIPSPCSARRVASSQSPRKLSWRARALSQRASRYHREAFCGHKACQRARIFNLDHAGLRRRTSTDGMPMLHLVRLRALAGIWNSRRMIRATRARPEEASAARAVPRARPDARPDERPGKLGHVVATVKHGGVLTVHAAMP